jgi:hypothetical protein
MTVLKKQHERVIVEIHYPVTPSRGISGPGSSITESDTSDDEGPHMISTCKAGALAVSEMAGEDE